MYYLKSDNTLLEAFIYFALGSILSCNNYAYSASCKVLYCYFQRIKTHDNPLILEVPYNLQIL